MQRISVRTVATCGRPRQKSATFFYGLFARGQNHTLNILNIYRNKHRGWTFTVYCSIITIIWIIVQQLMSGYFILQTIIAAVGLLILVAALMPRVMRFYEI